ncbi:hypothetical protein G6F57_005071 [Rhizopus arrhizus]|uniref:Triosephosphate isomerase n=1 Tax=Rhizopus oryzae TaxID=64495 RepID=A0A9P6XB32_RHIOR|nr:hypothetical protein G6F20_006301 [Rhizopus arrhizus]KAG0833064.1 hypothetical protein G6F19_005892 [Rhizopus arrhizus]KAG0835408.1 hypothetical protein G6F18_005843 [Rhizopus arrhizus]KAG0897826.1 hypothetical protein G6F34_006129 [Rhizopus arrhizus]KAG0946222.1 hypothetical protein G6F32_006654 [Rhizopus arrhizus]
MTCQFFIGSNWKMNDSAAQVLLNQIHVPANTGKACHRSPPAVYPDRVRQGVKKETAGQNTSSLLQMLKDPLESSWAPLGTSCHRSTRGPPQGPFCTGRRSVACVGEKREERQAGIRHGVVR